MHKRLVDDWKGRQSLKQHEVRYQRLNTAGYSLVASSSWCDASFVRLVAVNSRMKCVQFGASRNAATFSFGLFWYKQT